MPVTKHAILVEAGGHICEDRAEIINTSEATVLVVADGVGGMPGGQAAADALVEGIEERPPGARAMETSGYGVRELMDIGEEIFGKPTCGQTTAVVVAIGHEVIRGASIGDSEAWLFTSGAYLRLTAGQTKSPFLGSGAGMPRPFLQYLVSGRLLVATDGLFRYAAPETIHETAVRGEPDAAAEDLLELVRLPSGDLQDDVAIILADIQNTAV
ncbi:MAG: PP2C family protein-serine/threonine phosphatase [Candidatus Brocadiia bacterium]